MLTDAICRNPPKLNKLSDKDGLYLFVREMGKYWRLDYPFQGLRKTATFDVYPKFSLKEAHEQCALFRTALTKGIDPNTKKTHQATPKRTTKHHRWQQSSLV